MMLFLLILAAAAQQRAYAQHPVRWTRAVGPPSRQALQAKLKQPVKRPPSQKIYEHTGRQREIRTCADYAHARKNGWSDSANTYERSTEAFFKDQCDVALLVLAAEPSRVSFVRNFKLDEAALDLLPPSLSWILSGEEEQAADDAEHQGLSWKKFKPELKIRGKYLNGMTVEESGAAIIDLEIKAFGDFNGDGIEDVLLFKSTHAIEGTFRYYQPVILTRIAAKVPLKAFEVEDTDIAKATSKLRRSGPDKPPKVSRSKGNPR